MNPDHNPHQGIGKTETSEWADDGEATPTTSLDVVKQAREASSEADVASPPADAVSSEQTPVNDEPPTERETPADPEPAAPDKDTAAPEDTGPDADAGHARRYAEKFDSPDALEAGYRNLATLKGRLDSQLAQAQHQVRELQEQLAQTQRVTARAPRFEELSPDDQQRLAAEALEEDPYLREDQEGWRKRCQDLAKQEWKAEQAALRLLDQGTKQANQAQRSEALSEVVEYGSKLEKHSSHVLDRFQEHPEVFEVMRQMEPAGLKRFGKRYLDLLATEAEMQTLRAQQPDRDAAMRQAGRKESRETEALKDAGRSVASQATTVKTAPPQGKPAAQTQTAIQRLLDSNASKAESSTLWE